MPEGTPASKMSVIGYPHPATFLDSCSPVLSIAPSVLRSQHFEQSGTSCIHLPQTVY